MMKNAIVCMFDSLQYNYLGCYGNEWIKTPNFDRFAREGVLFENSYTEGLPTIPCRRAMHTCRFTIAPSGWSPLTMEDTTIADLCWGRPIDTALIFDCPMYRQPKFGYTRGFDKVWFEHGHENDNFYYDSDKLYHFDPKSFVDPKSVAAAKTKSGAGLVDHLQHETTCYLKQMQYWRDPDQRWVGRTYNNAIAYLEQVDRNKQFFLWIDSFDPHEPWNGPSVFLDFPCPYDPDYKGAEDFNPIMGDVNGVYDEAQLHHVRMLYAEIVTLCDKHFGRLMDTVRRLGFEENTLMMVVSDHGEPMGNGEHGHGIMRKSRPWPYEELVHTPMLMRGPGLPAGKHVKGFVQSCDVAPTVCDWLGIGVHPDMQGFSLLPLAKGEVEKVRDFAVAGYYRYSWSIITEDWSYIHWPKGEQGNDSTAYVADFFTSELEKTSAHLGAGTFDLGADTPVQGEAAIRAAKDAATLDGADQWTCTPGSVVEVPAIDELYNRKKDPKQLHNVVKENPEVARELLQKVRTFISGLPK